MENDERKIPYPVLSRLLVDHIVLSSLLFQLSENLILTYIGLFNFVLNVGSYVEKEIPKEFTFNALVKVEGRTKVGFELLSILLMILGTYLLLGNLGSVFMLFGASVFTTNSDRYKWLMDNNLDKPTSVDLWLNYKIHHMGWSQPGFKWYLIYFIYAIYILLLLFVVVLLI